MALSNWFRRGSTSTKPGPKPGQKPEQKPGQKPEHPLADSRKVQEVIAKLPANDSVQAIGEIAGWIEMLNTADGLKLDSRFENLNLLDGASRQPERRLFADYLATPRQKKAHEHRLWSGAFNFWRLLGEGYHKCLERVESEPGSALTSKASMAIYIGRALRCLRHQLRWNLMRYELPEGRVWTMMARLFESAEEKELMDESISVYPGSSGTSSVRQEFMKGMILAASSTDSLQPPGQDLAVRIVSYFSGMFVVSKEAAGCTHWIDLAEPRAPVRVLRNPPAVPTIRYIGAGPALRELEQLRAHISYTRSLPADLNLGEESDHEVVLDLLQHLEQDWAGKTQARRHERKKTAARVTVVPGFKEIVSALEFAINDSLDFTHQKSAESWIVQDMSAGGYGAVIPAVAGDWVEVGSVVGVEGESFREWRVGLIRRVTRNEQQQQHVGVQLLTQAATLLRLRPPGSPAPGKSTAGVLLTPQIEGQKEVEILTPRGHCARRDGIETELGDKTYTLVPVDVVEHDGDYDRVTFTVVH
jgi:hypothetical protein